MGGGGDDFIISEDSDAFRRVQEMELMKKGIGISESTKKKKMLKRSLI